MKLESNTNLIIISVCLLTRKNKEHLVVLINRIFIYYFLYHTNTSIMGGQVIANLKQSGKVKLKFYKLYWEKFDRRLSNTAITISL